MDVLKLREDVEKSLDNWNGVSSFRLSQRPYPDLTQSVMRLMKRTIEEMAKVTPDGRNAATVELAKKITEITDGYSLPLV